MSDILGVKPGARILDATAANRCIWETKESRWIVYMDVEPELEVKPDVICDNRHTPYPDGYFHHIVFDPPHGFGRKPGDGFYECRNIEEHRRFLTKFGYKKTPGKPTYYGMDKYRSKGELLGYLNKALQEFYRILEDGGVLMMKWCELEIPFDNIKPFLRDWDIMMKLKIGDGSQTRGSTQTWWVLLMKKEKSHVQTELV